MIDESGFMHAPIVPLTLAEVAAAKRMVHLWAAQTGRTDDDATEVLDILGLGDPVQALVEEAA